MQQVLLCLRDDHNLWLVLLAALVCISGSWVAIRLFERSAAEPFRRRIGWLFLTGVAAGGAIWCTHFIAMLGYDADADIRFTPLMTGASFFVAIIGTIAGFGLACAQKTKYAAEIGGAVVGLSIATMHYTGMLAFAVEGLIMWNRSFVSASVFMGTIFGAAATRVAMKSTSPHARRYSVALLTLSIVSMHFTGMAAMDVQPFVMFTDSGISSDMIALATSVGGVGLLVVGMGVTSIVLDQEIRDEANSELRKMALHDALTGLPNRVFLANALAEAVAMARKNSQHVAVVALDLDRFKDINDRFGHDAGDEALLVFSRRISQALARDVIFARVGGDEFLVVKIYETEKELEDFVRDLAQSASEKTQIRGINTMLGASLGISVYPSDAENAEELMKSADLAMYRAKQDPTSNLFYFEPELDNIARRKRELASDLARAIDGDELVLYYQVQKNIETNQTIGFEALLRWRHPDKGMVSPAEFIPLAEETGLIVPIGEWVLRRACIDAASWQSDYKVAVNISAVQFAKGSIDRIIEDALWQSGLSPQRLEIEITESVLMADMNRTIEILMRIKALGVSVAMDDFGTGHSSLANLQAFSFDKIKLDRGFVWKVDQCKDSQAIIRAVLALGQSLNVPILAEGVETGGQRDFLLGEGCVEVQGFLYGRPAPLEKLGDWQVDPSQDTALGL